MTASSLSLCLWVTFRAGSFQTIHSYLTTRILARPGALPVCDSRFPGTRATSTITKPKPSATACSPHPAAGPGRMGPQRKALESAHSPFFGDTGGTESPKKKKRSAGFHERTSTPYVGFSEHLKQHRPAAAAPPGVARNAPPTPRTETPARMHRGGRRPDPGTPASSRGGRGQVQESRGAGARAGLLGAPAARAKGPRRGHVAPVPSARPPSRDPRRGPARPPLGHGGCAAGRVPGPAETGAASSAQAAGARPAVLAVGSGRREESSFHPRDAPEWTGPTPGTRPCHPRPRGACRTPLA